MPESKHTPGPWFVFGNGHCVGGPKGFIDGDPREQTAGVAMCGMRLRTDDEAEANARLIAAAPDLLDVAETFLAMHQEYLNDPDAMYPDKLLATVRHLAEAAVKKAKGE